MYARILKALKDKKLLSDTDAEEILKLAEGGESISDMLLSSYAVSEDLLTKIISDASGLPTVRLYEREVSHGLSESFRADELLKNLFIPFEYDEETNILSVAVCDPLNMYVRDMANSRGYRIRVFLASKSDIVRTIDKIYGSEEMKNAASVAGEAKMTYDEERLLREEVNYSPLVKLVDEIIKQAVRRRASDIHIEPLPDKIRVRYRIDGTLLTIENYEISLLPAISARIKIMSGCDISEKRLPQDGQFSMTVDGSEYDIRVSVLPTVNGEKCMLRVSRKYTISKSWETLGFLGDDLEKFNRILHRPNGLVLVAGPTGSGKTTTMYAALEELRREGINIVTVEDPVEVMIEGVNQVQVNGGAGLTFSKTLRSILRQDPDVILIGEVRDDETAEIAIQASITGHLVLSTLHTSDTAGSITRLRNMGIEEYLIADGAVGIIAQRLTRILCTECKRRRRVTGGEAKFLNLTPQEAKDVYVYDAAGCPKCEGTGYYGRTGVFEIMEITPTIRDAIASGTPSAELKRMAVSEGMKTLDSGIRSLVLSGITSPKEAERLSLTNIMYERD
ncbi:MAG: GspE/PulE family protein [Firmicutes bacterium]|nr:GspE/PulE family protein [Bacillota bacterium]